MRGPVKTAAGGRLHAAALPGLAVVAVCLVAWLLDALVDLDGSALPKPNFRSLVLPGYPDLDSLDDAAAIIDAGMWWLCLSLVLWVAGLGVVGLCWMLLHRATQHAPPLRRQAGCAFVAVILLAAGTLLYVAAVLGKPLMSFALVVDNLGLVSKGFVRLAGFNTALAFVVGAVLLLSLSLLLLPRAHADHPMSQMRAITTVMYASAVFLLLWISAATSMYRLSAMLLVPAARDPLLKLAPTIGLMGGLFLSLLLAAAYGAACAWLQRRHEALGAPGTDGLRTPAEGPQEFLAAHWPKAVAILMPLFPGAIESVVQAVAHAP
jgi:hypothetical protein